MKTTTWISLALAACVLAVAPGCKKKDAQQQAPQSGGVTIDMPKLRAAFQDASPELKQIVEKAQFGLRYGDYMSMLMELDKLSNSPGLTEPQKKIVTQVIEEVKQVMSKAPPKA